MEPDFRSLHDSGVPKDLVRPKHYTNDGQHSTAIYLLDDTGGAHMLAILHYAMEGGATITGQVDLSPWARQSCAELASKFAPAAVFSTTPMDGD